MGIMDLLKRKKERESISSSPETTLPSELEQFRMPPVPPPQGRPIPPPRQQQLAPLQQEDYRFREYYQQPPQPEPEPEQEAPEGIDKLDMIIQKLETIDARLKLLEEKLRK
ncbi:MAG TPA: hypothetical protein VJH90_01720 [archaeon]|nr:hypothetical protein [archaeon]